MVDFNYYSNIYRGSIVPEKEFEKFVRKAEFYINSLIFGRDITGHTESVKLAVCNVAELFYLDEERQGISSENTDGYSVSYSGGCIEKSAYDAAAVYLADSGLMYAGAGD